MRQNTLLPGESQRKLLGSVSEESFQNQVINLARMLGWKVAHFRPGRTKDGGWKTAVSGDGKGFPDMVLVRERVIYAELKRETGKINADQELWIEQLQDAGQEVYVWRPRDLDAIERILRERTP